MTRGPVLISAPGAGLGHLVRASALALELEALGLEVRIASNSPFTEGLARLTGLALDHIPSPLWRENLPLYQQSLNPALVVIDSFPWGLRGEWRGIENRRFVLLARRLKTDEYLKANGLTWDKGAAQLRRVIVAEPLAEPHLALLRTSAERIEFLPGRIRFPSDHKNPTLPDPLASARSSDRCWLVVHSGPVAEVKILIDLARRGMAEHGGGELFAVLPRGESVFQAEPPEGKCSIIEYFPASALFDRAFRVVAGGGYNSLADLAPWPDKQLLHPFDRKYDDQAGRLAGPSAGPENGAPAAAELIASWL